MTAIVLCGDAVTTTTLVLAFTWPVDGTPSAGLADPPVAGRDENGGLGSHAIDRLIVESDPAGGSLVGWLGLDPLRTLTSAVTGPAGDRESTQCSHRPWQRHAQELGDGIAVLASPIRSVEAAVSQVRAQRSLLGEIGSTDGLTAFIDSGRGLPAGPWVPPGSTLVVLVHRQFGGPATAAGPRVEQLRERFESLEAVGHRLAVLIIGSHPFDPAEIAAHLSQGGAMLSVALPEDRFAAEVLAGRRGCSSRRLHRLRLMRAGREASSQLSATLSAQGADVAGPGPQWGDR